MTAENTWGVNGLICRNTGSATYYTFDPQGSVVQQLDASQNILSTCLYDAWGGRVMGSNPGPFGYDGQWGYTTDGETGLLLLTHRYYDPSQGRFLTRDPIGYAGGVNLYGYVGDNSPNGIDPYGWKNKFKSLKCGELRKEIERAVNELKGRYDAMHYDRELYQIRNCANPVIEGKGSWYGHVHQYYGWQRRPQQLLDEWNFKKCGPPPNTGDWAVMPSPLPVWVEDKPLVDETWEFCIPAIKLPLPDIGGACDWAGNFICKCGKELVHAF